MNKDPVKYLRSSSASTNGPTITLVPSSTATNSSFRTENRVPRQRREIAPTRNKQVEGAVFAHIQALRALGKTEVNIRAISEALEISEADILASLESLSRRGVKIK